jgi:molybdate transport system ATP-binding protein
MLNVRVKKSLHGSLGDMQLDIELNIKKGQFVALSGESGSGKTTLLRILAGLEEAEGSIEIENRVWLDGSKSLPPQKRGIGFVFQDYALFNNMTVLDNLLFVNGDRELARHLLDITELTEMQKRYPAVLSGGQKQRVALCRALMNRPKLLLMDEPLSALDPAMRIKLQDEILKLHREFETTTIMVSHDPSEIYRLASRVLVMGGGKIIGDGTSRAVLLNSSDSEQSTLRGKILEIDRELKRVVVLVGQQITEVTINRSQINSLTVGEEIVLSDSKLSPF